MVAECLGIQAISRLYMEIITRDHKNQDVPKAWTDESVQEESCICLGEEEAKDIYPPIFFSAPESEYSLEIIEEEEKKVKKSANSRLRHIGCQRRNREKLRYFTTFDSTFSF